MKPPSAKTSSSSTATCPTSAPRPPPGWVKQPRHPDSSRDELSKEDLVNFEVIFPAQKSEFPDVPSEKLIDVFRALRRNLERGSQLLVEIGTRYWRTAQGGTQGGTQGGGYVQVEVGGVGRIDLPVPEGTPVPSGDAAGDLGIAVRPEKVRIHDEAESGGRISLHGTVSQVVYYCDTSHVLVTLDSGHTLSAVFQNEVRSAAPAVQIGQKLWCSWNPQDTLILDN